MTQWINLLQNNKSVFWMAFAFGVPSASGSYSRQADENLVVLENFNVITQLLIRFGYLNRFSEYFTLYQ